MKSWISAYGACWPPNEGVFSVCDWPFSPWHARQGAMRCSTVWADTVLRVFRIGHPGTVVFPGRCEASNYGAQLRI
jgi:hypothetical protein